jgi:hypothetical protein
MRILILVTLAMLMCGFKFNDKVYVKSGFYERCYGTIIGRPTFAGFVVSSNYYIVKLRCGDTLISQANIWAEDMEPSAKGGE